MNESRKILIVDDNSVNLKMAEQVLQEFSKPVPVTSGREALKFLEKNIPDLILLDISMPDMDGFQVMEKIKENPKTASVMVIFLTAKDDTDTEVKCLELGAMDFVRKPFVPKVLENRVKHALEILDYRRNLERDKTRKIETIQREVIMSIANLIENRDGTTGQHVKRTSRYVTQLVTLIREKGLYPDISEEYYYNIIKAAPLHDIGKIAIPDAILQKGSQLTPEEAEKMKEHTVIGGDIIMSNFSGIEDPDYVKVAANVARYHHERWDGSGYPQGLKGKEIPLEARIMAIADVFDALISERCYKEAFTLDGAFEIMKESAGKQFDPELLDLFFSEPEQIERLAAAL